jgi:stearoyl-CoA desaturase (Delta-9 desaturase)
MTTTQDVIEGLRGADAPQAHLQKVREKGIAERVVLGLFVGAPFLAVFAAIPLGWNRWISWTDVILGAVLFAVACHGVTIGFHRLFTHGSFKAKRPLKITLALSGSLSVEGSLIWWVATHRKHHQTSDTEDDPHSPWAYGEDWKGLVKGLWHAHTGWLFDKETVAPERYAPDLLADRDLRIIDKLFPVIVLGSLALPAVIGGLLTMSWGGALQAFFWAGLVRMALVHHVTWSVNSVCHVWGRHPFKTRDRSGNVAWLAILSAGESWHNWHHSDPTCARHGVLKGQVDTSARLIELFEWFGWATEVRWPKPERVEARLVKHEPSNAA